jgi:hypothetical protein
MDQSETNQTLILFAEYLETMLQGARPNWERGNRLVI